MHCWCIAGALPAKASVLVKMCVFLFSFLCPSECHAFEIITEAWTSST